MPNRESIWPDPDPEVARVFEKYPSLGADSYCALPEPGWQNLDHLLSGAKPRGVQRAIARFREVGSEAISNDANLEGIAVTAPEVTEILGGIHVPGHTIGEQGQVADMGRATRYLLARVAEGPIEPAQAISADLHMFIAQHLNVPTTMFRGDYDGAYMGPQVALGRGETFRSLDARVLYPVLAAGLARIATLEHPVVRGATWAAFAAYQQFYFDGNKRAGRYVMNAVAMSHGFDAILVPAALKAQYTDVLVAALRSGDLTEHIRFLLQLYDDGHR